MHPTMPQWCLETTILSIVARRIFWLVMQRQYSARGEGCAVKQLQGTRESSGQGKGSGGSRRSKSTVERSTSALSKMRIRRRMPTMRQLDTISAPTRSPIFLLTNSDYALIAGLKPPADGSK